MHGIVAKPLVAVDRVLALDTKRVETEKYLSANELIFAGHYPQFPIYPGIFLLETILQSIGHWADSGGVALIFTGVKTLRLLAPALPGSVIRCVCTLRDGAENAIQFDAVCKAGGRTLARAVVEFIAGERRPA